MLEQRIVLEHKADPALLRRKIIYDLSVEDDFAGIRRLKSRQHPENGRFAAAAWAEQANQMSFCNFKADILHRMKISKMLVQTAYFHMHVNALPFFSCSIP
ncbi:hypothetical protein D3C71_1108720 [compost metagenome]